MFLRFTFESQELAATSSKIRDTTTAAPRAREAGGSNATIKLTVEPDKPPNSAKGSLPTPATTPSRSTPVPTQPDTSTSTQTQTVAQRAKDTAPINAEATKAASATPAPPVEVFESLIIPIVVKELPLNHPAVLAAPPVTGATATVLKHQPIIHDKSANMLVLSPIVFGTLTESDIQGLQSLGARKALDTLRERYTQFLKERLAANALIKKKKKDKHKEKEKTKHHDVVSAAKQDSDKTAMKMDEPAMKKRKLDNGATA